MMNRREFLVGAATALIASRAGADDDESRSSRDDGRLVRKKGVTNPSRMAPPIERAAVEALDVGWFHNYSVTPGSFVRYQWDTRGPAFLPAGWRAVAPHGAEFVPMVLDVSHANPRELELAEPWVHRAGVIMGPNEPYNYGEARNSVAEVLDMWPELERFGREIRLGSPSGEPNAWFDEFLNRAVQLGRRVDFFALHIDACWCETPSGLAEGLARIVERTVAAYGLPIWLTELTVYYRRGPAIQPDLVPFVSAFWDEALPYLEAHPAVERYSVWPLGAVEGLYGGATTSYSLADLDGSLTPLGENYAAR